MKKIQRISTREIKKGDEFDFGHIMLTEGDIILFAKAFDPLDFHIDVEKGKASPFGSIIASGPHVFTVVHRDQWIPRFGYSVYAGVELNNWKFLKPVFPEMNVNSKAIISAVEPNTSGTVAAITWRYEFTDDNGEMLQSLEMKVLHHLK